MIMSTNYEYNTIRDELHTYAITIGKNKQTNITEAKVVIKT